MLGSCDQQSLTRGLKSLHESRYLPVIAERPRASNNDHSIQWDDKTSTTIMARGPEINPYLRTKICEARAYGLSYKELYLLYPEDNRHTIQYTLGKKHIRQENVSRPRLGRQRKLFTSLPLPFTKALEYYGETLHI